MYYKIFAILCMIIFYLIYIYKLISLNKQSIKTNQVGKGNKTQKVIIIEKLMNLSNVIVIIAQVLSVIFVSPCKNVLLVVISIIFGVLAIIFFLLATNTMKNNWRVGIPEEKTSLVINGIYKWSRNPAFVGFDLLYISNTILFFNVPLLICSLFAIVMLHLQILQEEQHMLNVFGKEYEEYKKHTLKYLGRK